MHLPHALALAQREGDERSHALTSPPDTPERLHRRRGSREDVTRVGLGSAEGTAGDAAFPRAVDSERLRDTHQSVFVAWLEVSNAARHSSAALSRLEDSMSRLHGTLPDVFVRFVEYGLQQQRWIDAELEAVSRMAHAASEVEDPDMRLALLRLTGSRLEAAMLGSFLLAAWLDHLELTEVVLRECRFYSVETLAWKMFRLRDRLEPAMKVLSSLEPWQVETAAADLPALMGYLTDEFHATREDVPRAARSFERAVLVKELLETLALGSAMAMALPRLLLPATSLTLGTGLAMGSNGVMMGTQVVVSAEWVEMMRRLVQAGVISLSAVSAAVRIRSGQVLMAQAHEGLPQGVREALGDGPEVRGMRVTGRAGAGMGEPPKHHVLPKEFREWFEKRGFTGEMSIDQFCVRMERASHEAIHGGGNWKLGRKWPGEWNRMIMKALGDAETRVGRMLTRNEVLDIVAKRMRNYDVPMKFTSWR